jgi:hypothetical protein
MSAFAKRGISVQSGGSSVANFACTAPGPADSSGEMDSHDLCVQDDGLRSARTSDRLRVQLGSAKMSAFDRIHRRTAAKRTRAGEEFLPHHWDGGRGHRGSVPGFPLCSRARAISGLARDLDRFLHDRVKADEKFSLSFASANVDFATKPRSPMLYNFVGCAPRQASMSRKLSRYVICAKAMMRNCSVQRRVRTRRSPSYFATRRSKLVHGTKSMTCEKSVRPVFTAMSSIGKIEKITAKTRPEFKSTPKKSALTR